jgi:hypothetical protein
MPFLQTLEHLRSYPKQITPMNALQFLLISNTIIILTTFTIAIFNAMICAYAHMRIPYGDNLERNTGVSKCHLYVHRIVPLLRKDMSIFLNNDIFRAW